MSEPISCEEQRQIDQWAETVASDLASGKPAAVVSETLVKQGWGQANAEAFVGQVQNAVLDYRSSPQGRDAVRDAKQARNQRNMVVGGLWCGGGTVITLLTYGAASSAEGGGTYVVAWGAIVIGAVQFLAGFFGWVRDG